jgi:hypothetical protein
MGDRSPSVRLYWLLYSFLCCGSARPLIHAAANSTCSRVGNSLYSLSSTQPDSWCNCVQQHPFAATPSQCDKHPSAAFCECCGACCIDCTWLVCLPYRRWLAQSLFIAACSTQCLQPFSCIVRFRMQGCGHLVYARVSTPVATNNQTTALGDSSDLQCMICHLCSWCCSVLYITRPAPAFLLQCNN